MVTILIMSCCFYPVCAQTTIEDANENALFLINEKISLEMQRSSLTEEKYNSILNDINEKLIDIGVHKMSEGELQTFVSNTQEPEATNAMFEALKSNECNGICSSGPPCPSSTDKIDFYYYANMVNGKAVYSVIASPVANSAHSCNTVSNYGNMKSNLNSLTNLVQIYVDKAIGLIPVVSWLPYEVFTDLAFNGTSPTQLQMYEARLVTRTVHQFIYLQNASNQWVYYGSANCVHVNVEQIARKYVGSVLKTETDNQYHLEVAPDYYEWPSVCVGDNLTGYNVTAKHSFVYGVQVRANNNVVLDTNVVTATLPIHVVN